MAAAGNKAVEIYSWLELRFSWWQTGQSVENNATTIEWKTELISGNGALYKSSRAWEVTIDGVKKTGTVNISLDKHSVQALARGTATIPHNADGSKTFSFSFSQSFNMTLDNGNYMGSYSGSGSATLNTIARASQPSCITWPEHTQNVGNFGDEISIHMNRNSSSFTHTVRYQFGSKSGTIATGVGTGTTWVIPLTLMDLIPTTTSGSGTIYVDTYNGSTKIGTKYCGFTAKVPDSVKPTCSFTLEDTTGIDDVYGSPVKGLSKIKVTVTGNTAYSSPIASYEIVANGVRYTGSTATTGVLNTSGKSTVTAKVTDKRGRVGTASYDMNVQAYTPPVISALDVRRCNEDGTANEDGEFVKATISAAVSSMSSKNTALYKLSYKKSTDSAYTTVSLAELVNQYSVSNHEYIFAADSESSYDVTVTVSDRHKTVTRSTSASTAFTLMSFGADGTSIGLLKAAERSNAIDVGGDVYMNGNAVYGAHGMFDTRDANETPEWYMTTYGRGSVWEFKTLTAIGFTAPSSKFGPVETIIPWKDSSGGLPRQTAYEGKTCWKRIATSATTWGKWESEALLAYPVGSIYLAFNHVSPATLFGGTWERIYGAFPWFTDGNGQIGLTGGEREVSLTVKNLPAHNHGGTYTNAGDATKTHSWLASGGSAMTYEAVNVGEGEPHNNMPPYIQISAWRRTA